MPECFMSKSNFFFNLGKDCGEKYQNRIFWYQSYLQYLQGPSQGLTLLVVKETN